MSYLISKPMSVFYLLTALGICLNTRQLTPTTARTSFPDATSSQSFAFMHWAGKIQTELLSPCTTLWFWFIVCDPWLCSLLDSLLDVPTHEKFFVFPNSNFHQGHGVLLRWDFKGLCCWTSLAQFITPLFRFTTCILLEVWLVNKWISHWCGLFPLYWGIQISLAKIQNPTVLF